MVDIVPGRRVALLTVCLVAAALLSGCGARVGSGRPTPTARPVATHTAAASAAAPAPPAPAPIAFPQQGSRTYEVAPGTGPVIGGGGTLLRFQVSVERDITGLDAATVAAFVEETYADPRGWAAGGTWRFQRVAAGERSDFTLYLVTPATRDVLCAHGYDRYTNCREGDRVVLNAARWAQSVPDYGAPVLEYRRYALNHETGHRLGQGHELCPSRGAAAPVMQQQTLGLHGCVANAWPYVDGARYRGKSGAYSDPVPHA